MNNNESNVPKIEEIKADSHSSEGGFFIKHSIVYKLQEKFEQLY